MVRSRGVYRVGGFPYFRRPISVALHLPENGLSRTGHHHSACAFRHGQGADFPDNNSMVLSMVLRSLVHFFGTLDGTQNCTSTLLLELVFLTLGTRSVPLQTPLQLSADWVWGCQKENNNLVARTQSPHFGCFVGSWWGWAVKWRVKWLS